MYPPPRYTGSAQHRWTANQRTCPGQPRPTQHEFPKHHSKQKKRNSFCINYPMKIIIHFHFVDGNKEFGSKCRWMQRLKFIDVPAHAPCFTWKTTNTYQNYCFTSNNTVVQLSWAYLRPTIRTFLWNCSNFASFKIIISPGRPRSSPVNAMAGQQLCQVNGSCKESTKEPSMTRDFRLFFPSFFKSKYVHVAIHTKIFLYIYI